jgi:hypothetical protein
MIMQSFFSSKSSFYAALLLCGTLAIGGCTPSKSATSPSADKTSDSKTSEAKTSEAKTVASAASSGTPSFSLTDRRVIEQYNDKFMPEFEKKITENCKGAVVKIEIDWNSFGNGEEASKTIEALTNSNAVNRSVEGFVGSLQNICADDTGRKAVTAKLKTLRVAHAQGADKPTFKVENGTASFALNVTKNDSLWTQDIQKSIEGAI